MMHSLHLFYMLCAFFTNYSFFLQITQFFYSFNNSFNNAIKIFIQRIYSFKQNANNSFKEFIHSKKIQNYLFKEFIHSKKIQNYSFKESFHSKKSKIIHSKKIFIQVKNGLSPRASDEVMKWWYLISLNSLLFENIAYVGSSMHFVFVFVFVFVITVW